MVTSKSGFTLGSGSNKLAMGVQNTPSMDVSLFSDLRLDPSLNFVFSNYIKYGI